MGRCRGDGFARQQVCTCYYSIAAACTNTIALCSAAFSGSLDAECEIDGPISDACMEYSRKLEALQTLTQSHPQQSPPSTLQVPAIPLPKATARASAPPSPALDEALQAVRETQEKYGAKSAEARVAWSEVEDVAAAGLANALGSQLNPDECSITEEAAMEACEALEGLNQAIREQQNQQQ